MYKNKNQTVKYFIPVLLFSVLGFVLLPGRKIKSGFGLNYKIARINSENISAEQKYEFLMLRDPVTNRIPYNIRERELKFAETLPSAVEQRLQKGIAKVKVLNWTLLGPANQGGRTRALAIDVSNENVILAGGVSGGLWRSTDGGNSWSKTTKPEQLQSVSCITQDTRAGHTNVFYYGTGEGVGNSASGYGAPYRGDGIFKSTDGGLSWNLLPSTSNNTPQTFSSPFDYVWNIAIDPSNLNQDVLYAAIFGEIERSTDGGNSWETVLGGNMTSVYTDVAVSDSGVVYAALSLSNDTASGIWRSPTGLKGSFKRITPAGWPANYNRIVLGLAPSDQKVLYVIAETPGGGRLNTSLWKYTDGSSQPWQDRSGQIPAFGQDGNFDSQGSYDLLIKVKPDDENFVIIGGTNLYRSTDGFATPIDTSDWIGGYATSNNNMVYPNQHPDEHSLVFLPSNPKVMYSGNDGGISKTSDNTATPVTWVETDNGYITSQFYSVAMDMSANKDSTIIGGLQDNGNYYYNSNQPLGNWLEFPFGGDGGITAIADNKTSFYVETQNGDVLRQVPYTDEYTTVTPKGASNFLFVAPYVLDPNNSVVMYMPAGDTLWRNSDLESIPLFSNNPTSVNWKPIVNNGQNGDVISAVAVSQTPANVVYFGDAGGKVFKIPDGSSANPSAENITGSNFPAGAFVSCIAVDPENADNVTVVFSNYSVVSLFNSTDGGATWTDVSGNLEQYPDGSGDGPSCRWLSILHNNNILYYFVATSTGVYSTPKLNGLNTVWSQEGSNSIGNIVCTMIRGRNTDGKIVVATHGNGVYASEMMSTRTQEQNNNLISFTLYQNYPNPFNPSTKIKYSIPALPAGNRERLVTLKVYDILGREVATLVDEEKPAGTYEVTWNAASADGGLPSGVYFYRLKAGNFTATKKLLLLK